MLNVQKTKLLHFNYAKEPINRILTDGDRQITTNSSAKFLGILIDTRLEWKPHIDDIAKSLSKYVYACRSLTSLINVETALLALHAYIQSRIRYGIIFWGNSTDSLRIFRLQKKCIRAIFKLKQTDSCKEYFQRYKILTLPSLLIYESIIFVSENITLFNNPLSVPSDQYNTRNKNNIKTIKYNFSYLQKQVNYVIIKIYNKIQSTDLSKMPIKKLKQALKVHLTIRAYYSLDEFLNDDLVLV